MITAEKLKNNFLGLDEKFDTILDLFDKHNKELYKMVGVGKSNSTYNKYTLARRRVKEFIKYRHNLKDMPVHKMNKGKYKKYNFKMQSVEIKFPENYIT